jgi:hypothetical protein
METYTKEFSTLLPVSFVANKVNIDSKMGTFLKESLTIVEMET